MESDDEAQTSGSPTQDPIPASELAVPTSDQAVPASEHVGARKALEDTTEATLESDSDFGDEGSANASNPIKNILKGSLGDDDFEMESDDEAETSPQESSPIQVEVPTSEHAVPTSDQAVPASEHVTPKKAPEEATEATVESDSDFGEEDPVSESSVPKSNPLKDTLKGSLGDKDFEMESDDEAQTPTSPKESPILDAAPASEHVDAAISEPRKALEASTEATFESDSGFGDENSDTGSPVPASNLLKGILNGSLGDDDILTDDE